MFLQLFEDDEKPDVELEPGETLFREGDEGDRAFVVRSGAVNLSMKGRPISIIGESQIFGEMALLDDRTRSATAIAGPDGAKLHSLDKALFIDMVKIDPEFAIELMKVMVERLRSWTAK